MIKDRGKKEVKNCRQRIMEGQSDSKREKDGVNQREEKI